LAGKAASDTPYISTGVTTRDHVRKSFWEIFTAEPDISEGMSNKDVVDALEN